MEVKNRELNEEELEQGVGGVSAHELFLKQREKVKKHIRYCKLSGISKEEFIKNNSGNQGLVDDANRYWDSIEVPQGNAEEG